MEENVYDHIWAAVERNRLTMRSVAAYLDRPVPWLILLWVPRHASRQAPRAKSLPYCSSVSQVEGSRSTRTYVDWLTSWTCL